MKFVTLATALAALLPAAIALSINTPSSVVACEPTLLTWDATEAPYYLSAIPAGQTASAPLEQIASGLNTTSYTWTVNIGAGTNINIALKDGLGAVAYTSLITVQSGGSSNCSSSTTQPSTGGSSGGSATSGSGSSSGSTAGSSSPSSSATTTASSSSSSSTSTKSNGAGRLSVSSAIGVAGIMGLVGAALF